MRIKGVNGLQLRRWKKEQEKWGYCPHYLKRRRVLIEVRFLAEQPRGDFWRVVNTATGECFTVRKNGTPLAGIRGVLIGPLIRKRKVNRV